MICERFILATLCSASIGLVADSSLAIELETARHSSQEEKGTIAVSVGQSSFQGEIESPTGTNEIAEPPRAIDRRLAMIAMAVTSIIALLLTINLFRRPKRKITGELTVLKQSNHLEEAIEKSDENKQIAPSLLPSPINRQGVTELGVATSNWEREESAAGIESSEANGTFSEEALSSAQLIQAKNRLGDIDVVAELISDLQQSDRQLRRKAIWELAERGDARSLKPLIEIFSQVSPLDKSLVTKAVTQIIYRSFQPINDPLFAKLQDRNPEIRKNAIRDLRDLYLFVAPITKKLLQMQQDADRGVSKTATQALQQLNLGFLAQKLDNIYVHPSDRSAIEQEDRTIWQSAALLSEMDDEK